MVAEEKERVKGQAEALGEVGLAKKTEQLEKAIAQNEVCPTLGRLSCDCHVTFSCQLLGI